VLSILAALAITSASTSATPRHRHRDLSSKISGSVKGLITADDYPPDALDLDEHGAVGVRLRVDKTGAVSGCTVVFSSGYSSLHAQTCRILKERAKYKPARDKRGRPIASETPVTINWRLEEDQEDASIRSNILSPREDWGLRTIIALATGKPPSCRMELGGAIKGVLPETIECSSDATTLAGALQQAPDRLEVVLEQGFAMSGEPKIAMQPSDRLISRQLARLEVDAAGTLKSCKIIETAGSIPPGYPGACTVAPRQFEPRKDAGGPTGTFKALYVWATYIHVEKQIT
jgi:TonB family protein